jgi:hypothetical protein
MVDDGNKCLVPCPDNEKTAEELKFSEHAFMLAGLA